MREATDRDARLKYNGLDAAATLELAEIHRQRLNANAAAAMVYRAENAIQRRFIEVAERGLRVDPELVKATKAELIVKMNQERDYVERLLGHPLNLNSPQQLVKVFSEELHVKLKRLESGKLTTKAEVIEKIAGGKPTMQTGYQRDAEKAVSVARSVLAFRDAAKQIGMLKSFGTRLRFSLNAASTDTFRASSSKDSFRRGLNAQTLPEHLRKPIIPDVGKLFGAADQEQAESRVVAYVSGDQGYIAAHNAADTHTYVSRLIWPDAPWTGDDKKDREFAEQKGFKRHWSRRDLAKRVQHGSNYGATAHALARTLNIPVSEAQEILDRYFAAFPGILNWQRAVASEVRTHGVLTYPGGYVRQFYGRRWDDHTVRAALASIPQSIVAWTTHLVFSRMYDQLDDGETFMVMHHIHDEVLWQYDPQVWPKERQLEVLTPLFNVEWPWRGSTFVIPWSPVFGGNSWGDM